MSYERLRAIRESGLTSTQKHVANMLSLRADMGGECWASATTLADDASLDEKTVRRTLVSLVDIGVITRRKRTGTSDVYAFAEIPVRLTPDIPSPRTQSPAPPDRTPGVPRTQSPDTPDTVPDDQPTDQPKRSAQEISPPDSAREASSSKPFSVETTTTLSPDRAKTRNSAETRLLVATALDLERETYPERYADVPFGGLPRLRSRKDERAMDNAGRDGATPDDLRTLWAYMHKSGERDPAWFRADPTLMFWGSIYNDSGKQRMAAARGWETRCRVDMLVPREIRGPPARAPAAVAAELFMEEPDGNRRTNGIGIVDTHGDWVDARSRDRPTRRLDG